MEPIFVLLAGLLVPAPARAEVISCPTLSFAISLNAKTKSQTKTPAGGVACSITSGGSKVGWTSTISPATYSWNSGAVTFAANPTSDSGTTKNNGSDTFRVGGTATANAPAATAGTYKANLSADVVIKGKNYSGVLPISVAVTWPMTASATTTLRIGRVTRSAVAGTVTMLTSGVRTDTGGAMLAAGGGETPGVITVSAGVPGATILISYPASRTLTSGGNSMTLDNFTAAGSPTSIVTDYNTGTASFNVGGRISVGANQALGTYTGTVPITLTYQ